MVVPLYEVDFNAPQRCGGNRGCGVETSLDEVSRWGHEVIWSGLHRGEPTALVAFAWRCPTCGVERDQRKFLPLPYVVEPVAYSVPHSQARPSLSPSSQSASFG